MTGEELIVSIGDKENVMRERDAANKRAAEAEAREAALREALRELAGAANAVYIEDDAFTEWQEGDGRSERDDALNEAIHGAVVALKASSPTALALVELERAARLAWAVPNPTAAGEGLRALTALGDALANLDRARGGK